ncbi:hypothetical protein GALMADRAFT_246966 [Galerina marginata CBS 339.88]|uniref:SET domain-containing protein n=1 Tax=Galerina marginata (strain CBS 339.88) TaxID=685588 RepID=A0A067T9J9_GALM3|nr:hypothetical protein GALMADRAFT_246966 [Galerina marginata CBS 339.88]
MEDPDISMVPDSQEETYEIPADSIELVMQTYESVWNDYFTWDYEYSQQTIASLSRPYARPRPQPKRTKPPLKSPADPKVLVESCTITDYTYDGGQASSSSSKRHLIPPVTTTIDLSDILRPYPPYNMCTSISQNLLVGDDSHYMPFIPFSDDETYDYNTDIETYHYLAWQRNVADPDAQIIALQSMRRLLSEHGLSSADIDSTEVLPLECEVLEKLGHKRDFPPWRPLQTNPQLPQNSPDNPDSVISYSLDYFCANLNCLTGFCAMHDETSVKAQVPSSNPPKVPHIKATDIVVGPCGQDCFLTASSSSNSIGTYWTTKETEILSAALRYAPDSLPCDLSILCRKPCREIYRYQLTHPPPVQPPNRVKQSSYSSYRSFEDEKPSDFTPNMPCRHTGPCSAYSGCECFKNKSHCHSRCGCSRTCPRRWKGCTCARSGRVCGTKKCSCFRAHTECDPEVCIPCEARDHNSSLCRNVGLQRGQLKMTEVRESEWGLGLFVLEPCQERDLVAEYIGEMIHDPTVNSRNFHATHRGRSYVFNLNPLYSLDSAYAGNETRYMNHSKSPNCSTKVLLVNGQHRIGVYAARAIQAGEELFIDYGPTFWDPDKFPSSQVPGASAEMLYVPSYDDPKDATYLPSGSL